MLYNHRSFIVYETFLLNMYTTFCHQSSKQLKFNTLFSPFFLYMAKDTVETSFHLSKEVIEALKIKAAKEGKRFTRIVEEGLR